MTDLDSFYDKCASMGGQIAMSHEYTGTSVGLELLEQYANESEVTEARIIAQWLTQRVCDSANGEPRLDKRLLLEMAEHMGPEAVQSLFHAVKWMTRVA